tara:strand:+ start:1773 stop:2054 length:282 start_codon:yes stop_codon:yes gene_type:complete
MIFNVDNGTDVKITETRFYDQYGNKKAAFLEEGQGLQVKRIHGVDTKGHWTDYPFAFEPIYVCKVVNPSDQSKNYGVRDDMLVKVHARYLETE